VANGIRLYADTGQVDGQVSWTGQSCALDGVVIRADTINGSGTVSSAGRDLLLYGTGGVATGLHATGATQSLMPPANITSATHPAGGLYNDDAPPPALAWDRPYSTVALYRYVVGTTPDAVPTQQSSPVYAEALALPTALTAGDTYIDVITVDTNGIAGTVPHQFHVAVQNQPPALDSPSNPNQGTFTTNSAVTMHWTAGNPGEGYYWVLDHFPNTRPTRATGTKEATHKTPSQVLISNLAAGQWFFHMLAYDSMGYPTVSAEHFELDIGAAPSTGTIAGTVKDSGGGVIPDATVVIQRGLYTTTSDANGVYHFNNSVPAGTYEVVATKSGFQSKQVTLSVSASATTSQYFVLDSGSGCPSCSDQCSGVACPSAVVACQGSTAYAPPLWNGTCAAGVCSAAYNTTNATQTSCSYGCNDASGTCYDGQDGNVCSVSSNCSTNYCEAGGVCGTTYCANPGSYCGSGASCCNHLTCQYVSYPYYDYYCY
jgi:hypothetical protein